jgi:PHP family Zn ribbon phosphoesterase
MIVFGSVVCQSRVILTKRAWIANLSEWPDLAAIPRPSAERLAVSNVRQLPFRKIDLHVHTPWSACYSDTSATPRQIVDSALAEGLDAIAVTDHNTFDGVDPIREAADGTGLTVFPAVEITTDGGHISVLFDPETRVEDIRGFLGAAGLDRNDWGDGAHMAGSSAQEVLRKAAEWGGLTIAAHIERWPSGFTETKQPRKVKMAIHASDHLDALELTVPQSRHLWHEGKVRGYPKKRACTQGSDAHAPVEIGRRPVFARMESITLDALRSAIRNFTTDMAFPDDVALEKAGSTGRTVEDGS